MTMTSSTNYLFASNLLFACLIAMLYAAHVVEAADQTADGCHPKWVEAILYYGNTLETFSRGFCLGFGVRMMKFTWESGKTVSLRDRLQLSAESGLAVAAMVHGSAIFLPQHFREKWFYKY